MNVVYIFIASLYILLSQVNASALEEEINPNTQRIPFKYLSLDALDKGAGTFLPASFYTVWQEKKSPSSFVIAAPLSPCIGIVIEEIQSKTFFVFHKWATNNSEQIGDAVKSYLKSQAIESQEINLTMLTNKLRDDIWKSEVPGEQMSFRQLHQNKSQEEDFKDVKKTIQERLSISDDRINAICWDISWDQKQYKEASNGIIVDTKGNIFNCHIYEENLISDKGLFEYLALSDNIQYQNFLEICVGKIHPCLNLENFYKTYQIMKNSPLSDSMTFINI